MLDEKKIMNETNETSNIQTINKNLKQKTIQTTT